MNALILMAALVHGQPDCAGGTCLAPSCVGLKQAISWRLLPREAKPDGEAPQDKQVRKPLRTAAKVVTEHKPLRTRLHGRPLLRRFFGRFSYRRCR